MKIYKPASDSQRCICLLTCKNLVTGLQKISTGFAGYLYTLAGLFQIKDAADKVHWNLTQQV